MADINVERKRGPGIWPWIVGLVVLALLVFGITQLTGNRGDRMDRAVAGDTVGQTAPAAERGPSTAPAGNGTPGTGATQNR